MIDPTAPPTHGPSPLRECLPERLADRALAAFHLQLAAANGCPAHLLQEPTVPIPFLPAALANNRDYQALLTGVFAHPDADLPRLVLADWLDENAHLGDTMGERAELIRRQCDGEEAEESFSAGKVKAGHWHPMRVFFVRGFAVAVEGTLDALRADLWRLVGTDVRPHPNPSRRHKPPIRTTVTDKVPLPRDNSDGAILASLSSWHLEELPLPGSSFAAAYVLPREFFAICGQDYGPAANDRLAAKLWQFAQDDAFPEPAEADADSA